METLLAFFCGLIFAIGLGISGMTQPAKVTGFLDFTGHWDPSLAFVMAGAVALYALGYRFVMRWQKPIVTSQFDLPKARPVDSKLLIGAALFGAGWGLAGYCPGPALVSLATFDSRPVIFVAAMLIGMALHRILFARK